MSFILIKGTFHVKGYSPDGDSVRFKANDSAIWKKLSGPAVGLNARNHAQLRMEAIDALETHYEGFHQPMEQAKKACRFLLDGLGINDVVWDETESTVTKAKDGTKGYILARCTEKYRRPVAFVYAGETQAKDGSEIILDEEMIRESLNYNLLAKGFAYPTYYNGLFSDLRAVFSEAMTKAKEERRGFWQYDMTTSGFSVSDPRTLTDKIAVLPKLFRRIIDYMGDGGDIEGFQNYLLTRCEPLVRVKQVHFTRLDAIVEVKGNKVRLLESPENIIFLDKVLCKKS